MDHFKCGRFCQIEVDVRIAIGYGTVINNFCNIYHDKTRIGEGCRVGSYTEIGGAFIGNNVVIGAYCFICPGVTIHDNAWIGPRVTFTNDKFPPSPKEGWQETIIMSGARIGAGVKILCGVTIGKGALVGAGSVVTRNVPDYEVWAGVPARKLENANGSPRPGDKGEPKAE